MTEYLNTPQGRRIAYHRLSTDAGSAMPGVVFLGGFRSDMTGTKAMYLQDWAEATGTDFLRFDYSGHGASGGRFEDGCIGDWLQDAQAVLTALTRGPQVLVGSSMGGWIALLLARDLSSRVAGLVTVAAAPDFTEDGFWNGFSQAQRAALLQDGHVLQASEYDSLSYVITRRLIEDGRDHRVMDRPLSLSCPSRLLQGSADRDVPMSWGVRLLEHADCDDLHLTVVKGADHRFSTPECLALMVREIETVRDITRNALQQTRTVRS